MSKTLALITKFEHWMSKYRDQKHEISKVRNSLQLLTETSPSNETEFKLNMAGLKGNCGIQSPGTVVRTLHNVLLWFYDFIVRENADNFLHLLEKLFANDDGSLFLFLGAIKLNIAEAYNLTLACDAITPTARGYYFQQLFHFQMSASCSSPSKS